MVGMKGASCGMGIAASKDRYLHVFEGGLI